MKRTTFRFGFWLLAVFIVSCDEAPLIQGGSTSGLNSPASMVLVPGTSLGIVANANVNLERETGALIAVNLDTRELLTDTVTPIRSFPGQMVLDLPNNRLYVVDRGDDALLVFDVQIPGNNGEAISFTEVPVTNPVPEVSNGIRTDEEPFSVFLATGTDRGDVLLTTNGDDGSVSVIPVADLVPLNLNADNAERDGLPLISVANFERENSTPPPAAGATRFIPDPSGRLLFIPSTRTNNLFVLDTKEPAVEAMLDLSSVVASIGARGMSVDANGQAYLAHRALDGVMFLNVQNVIQDGNDFEVVDTQLVDTVITGTEPEGVLLSLDQTRLFVSSLGENTVVTVDIASRSILNREAVAGSSPSELVMDGGRGVFYSLNFLSDSISVFDETTGQRITTIQ